MVEDLLHKRYYDVKQFVLEAIKCLFQAVIDQVGRLIIDIVTKLIDQVLNTAFCQISNILKGIVKTIQNGINSGLKAISSITGSISNYGNFGGSFLQKIGNLISQFCDGQLSCAIGISSVTTGIGEKPDNSVYDFFDRLELFGGLPNDVNLDCMVRIHSYNPLKIFNWEIVMVILLQVH